jgi:hypothetical protein
LQLGRTPSELENTLTSDEFVHYLALFRIEPFGPWRDNWHSAQIASLIYNVNRGKKTKPIGPDAFMWKPAKTKKEIEAQQEKQTKEFMAALSAMATPKQEPIR